MPELNPAAVAVAPGTPYVTPTMLLAAPTGIVWSTLGAGSRPTEQQQFDEQVNLCRRATAMIDGYCNQPLRATVDLETLYGPGDMRFQLRPDGSARLLLSRSPVTIVLGGQVSAASSFPAQFTQIGPEFFKIENPLIGVYGTTSPGGADHGGQAVLLAPGFTWRGQRMGCQVQVAYAIGYPKPVSIFVRQDFEMLRDESRAHALGYTRTAKFADAGLRLLQKHGVERIDALPKDAQKELAAVWRKLRTKGMARLASPTCRSRSVGARSTSVVASSPTR